MRKPGLLPPPESEPSVNCWAALATVDVPPRFQKSKSVGAVFGLTCSKYQSGEIDRSGRISRCGDEMMRVMLYEAAQSMLYSKRWSWLKAWAMQIAKRRGMKKAIVALARRLAVILHRIWVDGTEFRLCHPAGSCFSPESAPRPFHYGVRGGGGTILATALPSDERQVQAEVRTHLIHIS